MLTIVVPSWCDLGKPLLNKDNPGHVKYYICLELGYPGRYKRQDYTRTFFFFFGEGTPKREKRKGPWKPEKVIRTQSTAGMTELRRKGKKESLVEASAVHMQNWAGFSGALASKLLITVVPCLLERHRVSLPFSTVVQEK